jgi:hypothetical protein
VETAPPFPEGKRPKEQQFPAKVNAHAQLQQLTSCREYCGVKQVHWAQKGINLEKKNEHPT